MKTLEQTNHSSIIDLQFNVDDAVSRLPADLLELPPENTTTQATPQDNPATENNTVNEVCQLSG